MLAALRRLLIKKIPGMNATPGKTQTTNWKIYKPAHTVYRGIFIAHIPMYRLR
jgi:hypothetical protein